MHPRTYRRSNFGRSVSAHTRLGSNRAPSCASRAAAMRTEWCPLPFRPPVHTAMPHPPAAKHAGLRSACSVACTRVNATAAGRVRLMNPGRQEGREGSRTGPSATRGSRGERPQDSVRPEASPMCPLTWGPRLPCSAACLGCGSEVTARRAGGCTPADLPAAVWALRKMMNG